MDPMSKCYDVSNGIYRRGAASTCGWRSTEDDVVPGTIRLIAGELHYAADVDRHDVGTFRCRIETTVFWWPLPHSCLPVKPGPPPFITDWPPKHETGLPLMGVDPKENYGCAKMDGEGRFLHRFDDESLAAMKALAKKPRKKKR